MESFEIHTALYFCASISIISNFFVLTKQDPHCNIISIYKEILGRKNLRIKFLGLVFVSGSKEPDKMLKAMTG